uniref:Uncharacterized protein n=1 Tax=Cannabis sativa TaxID=3483 RepID=A0A803PYV2_CANSA
FNSLLTVVYASNNRGERKVLWKDLCDLSSNENWCVMGDFNDILAKEERVGHKDYGQSSLVGQYEFAEAVFLNEGLFDHSPAILSLHPQVVGEKKPFKYFRMWKSHPKYDSMLKDIWCLEISGNQMYQVVCKLKLFKERLRKLNTEDYCDLQQQVHEAKASLDSLQSQLQQQPLEESLHQQERSARELLSQKHQDYSLLLKQK